MDTRINAVMKNDCAALRSGEALQPLANNLSVPNPA